MISSGPIKQKAKELGFELAGICSADPPESLAALDDWLERGFHGEMAYMQKHRDLRADLSSLLPGVRSVISVGMFYKRDLSHEQGDPRIARYAVGRDYHKVVRGRLRALGRWLDEQFPSANHRACVDSAPILEREYANRAGLGWYGKNTMIINSIRGSWFFLGELLTTLEIERDEPAAGGCGNCRLCIDACPTGAIVQEGGRWQIDSRKCISYLTIEYDGDISPELEGKMDAWTFGCDVCQEVCPFNKQRESQPERAPQSREPDFLNERTWPTLERLRVITDDEWELLTRGSALRRVSAEQIRRNARINLENTDS